MRVVGINKNYTMSIPLAILKILAADFDGDTLNVLLLYNQDMINVAMQTICPRYMYISHNDGKVDTGFLPARDIIINANALKHLCKYTAEQIEAIQRLQNME